MDFIIGFIVGVISGGILMATIKVGADPNEEIEATAYEALKLASKYIDKLVKIKEYVKSTVLSYNTEDAKKIIELIDGEEKCPDIKD